MIILLEYIKNECVCLNTIELIKISCDLKICKIIQDILITFKI